MTTYLPIMRAAELDAVQTLLSLQAGEYTPPLPSTSYGTIISSQVTNVVHTNISKKKIFLSKWNDTMGENNAVATKVTMSDVETQTDLELNKEISTIVSNEKIIKQLTDENIQLKNELKKYEQANSVMESSSERLNVSRSSNLNTPLPRKTRRRVLVDYKALNDDLDTTDSEEQVNKSPRGNASKKFKRNKTIATNTNSDSIKLGGGNATVSARLLKNIDWSCHSNATRKLLTAVFSRQVLATHSLTGKRSPAFPNKPAKRKLNAALVNDIVQTVVEKCGVPENLVRTSITTKCADESKMLRTRQLKKKMAKENTPPSDDSDVFYLSR